jgi:hypothetical protein
MGVSIDHITAWTLEARIEDDDGEGTPSYRAWVERMKRKEADERARRAFAALKAET